MARSRKRYDDNSSVDEHDSCKEDHDVMKLFVSEEEFDASNFSGFLPVHNMSNLTQKVVPVSYGILTPWKTDPGVIFLPWKSDPPHGKLTPPLYGIMTPHWILTPLKCLIKSLLFSIIWIDTTFNL